MEYTDRTLECNLIKTNSWEEDFRRAIKVHISKELTVLSDRGYIKVLYESNKEGFKSINLPHKWHQDQWFEAFKLIQITFDAYKRNEQINKNILG